MTADDKCARCGNRTPTNDNIAGTTFWGFLTAETVTTRRVRLQAHYFRHERGSLTADERKGVCSDCWGDLIGRFMQGRSVDALPGKEGR